MSSWDCTPKEQRTISELISRLELRQQRQEQEFGGNSISCSQGPSALIGARHSQNKYASRSSHSTVLSKHDSSHATNLKQKGTFKGREGEMRVIQTSDPDRNLNR